MVTGKMLLEEETECFKPSLRPSVAEGVNGNKRESQQSPSEIRYPERASMLPKIISKSIQLTSSVPEGANGKKLGLLTTGNSTTRHNVSALAVVYIYKKKRPS